MHKFTLEGHVKIASGRMLIIDPCYLEKFDRSVLQELFEPDIHRYRRMMKKEKTAIDKRIEAIDKLTDAVKYARSIIQEKLIDQKIPENEKKGILSEYKKKIGAFRQRLVRASEEGIKILNKEKPPQKGPRFYPPYIVQFPNYVLFPNRLGDGHYPVVQTARGKYIVFDVPIKPKDEKSFELDPTQLEGKILGWSSVDGGVQIVIDEGCAAKPGKDISPNAYCILKVPKGNYCCRFVENGWKLSIKKQN